jgi:hypothetical protein
MAEPAEGNAGIGSAENGNQRPGNVDALKNAFAGTEGTQQPKAKPDTGGTAGGNTETGSAETKLAPWAEQLPEELRGNQEYANRLSKFAKVGDMAKAYLELEAKISAAAVPENAEGYSMAKDKDRGGDVFASAAHAANLSGPQADALYKSLAETGAKNIEAAKAAQERQMREADAALRKEYGGRYEEKIELLTRGLSAAGPNVGRLLTQAGLSGNPEIIRAFISLGELTSESGSARGGTTGQPLKSIMDGGSFQYKETGGS